MPLTSTISYAHTQPATLFWLTLFHNNEKQISGIDRSSQPLQTTPQPQQSTPQPLQINGDTVITIVLSALMAFNSENLLQVLERAWRIVESNAKDKDLTLTVVHTCYFHLMQNARDIVKIGDTSQGPSSNAIWVISLLTNASTLKEMDTIFAIIVNITCSKQVNQNVSQNVGIMNKKLKIFEIATVYGSESIFEVDEALTREELNKEEKTLQL